MSKLHPDVRNFLRGALGYLVGATSGFLFIFIVSRLGLVRWLSGFVDESQDLIRLLALLVFAGLMVALGGAILGGIGGWTLGSILGLPHKRRQVIGSGIAFGLTVGSLILVFLLLIGFIGIYNNFTANRVEHYGIVFGFFGLVFGLLTGIFQAFLSLRLKDTWRVILASTLSFTIGGIVMGILVRLVNPTSGFQTYPILTWLVLILALLTPFALAGGALGFTYGRLAQRAEERSEHIENLQPSAWQTGIVALIGVALFLVVFTIIGNIKSFLTINPAPIKAVIPPVTTGVWWTDPQPLTSGSEKIKFLSDEEAITVVTGPDSIQYKAWCTTQGVVQYQRDDETIEQIDFPSCINAPAMAFDIEGKPHLVWYTSEIKDTNGVTRSGNFLVESIRTSQSWSEAAIATQIGSPATPSLSVDDQSNLVLVWKEIDGRTYTALQEAYKCNEANLNPVEKAGLENILAGGYRPPGTKIPYCRNEFLRIYYTPNPEPQYSTLEPTPNGGFDQVSKVVDTAQYEILFTVMQWEPNSSPPNPGSVLAEAVAKLYEAVQAKPERYPRGMTLRILLGNYPVLSDLQWGSQIWDALSDIRAAGVDKMVDPEIGWRLEIANYAGTYPHAHTKFTVVDGKRITAVGFNYGYLHFPKDHPSGKGYDLFDLGLLVTGPVAQDATSAYDDMWNGANQVHCEDLSLDNDDWKSTCTEKKAFADHVPEVLRTYLPPEGNTNSFSLYHTTKHLEADAFLYESLASAQQTVDLIEVNFSLEMVCMLNIIFPDFCTFDNALPWMNALIDAVETNGVKVRVIMENSNSNGLENRVAGKVFMDELKRRGLEDLVELRFYNGKVHAKSMLIDEEFLAIGSQNFHYSSWGEGTLAEYNVTTDDPQAIAEYQKMFETKWAMSTPFEEAEYSTTP